MAKRGLGWLLVVLGVWACSGGAEEEAGSSAPASAPDGVAPGEGDVAPVARYRFVDTSEGMTVEATSATDVTTMSCAARTCDALCDDCAARACRAAGEQSAACQVLVDDCNGSCRCGPGGQGCGFPVCAFDRMICYAGGDTSPPELGPNGPVDANAFGPAGRPSAASSNSARPAR